MMHHKQVLNNMVVIPHIQHATLMRDKYPALYINWKYTSAIFVIGIIETELTYVLLQYIPIQITFLYRLIWVMLFTVYLASFTNTLHPAVHHINETISWREGIPGWNGWVILFSSININNNLTLYKWLKNNHEIHHSLSL